MRMRMIKIQGRTLTRLPLHPRSGSRNISMAATIMSCSRTRKRSALPMTSEKSRPRRRSHSSTNTSSARATRQRATTSPSGTGSLRRCGRKRSPGRSLPGGRNVWHSRRPENLRPQRTGSPAGRIWTRCCGTGCGRRPPKRWASKAAGHRPSGRIRKEAADQRRQQHWKDET